MVFKGTRFKLDPYYKIELIGGQIQIRLGSIIAIGGSVKEQMLAVVRS
jgi:hypothetical protein